MQLAGLSANPVTPAQAPVKCRTRRDKEHSTIIYESGDGGSPLLRLGWNKQDPRYMATILMDSSKVRFVGRFATDVFFEKHEQRPKAKGFWNEAFDFSIAEILGLCNIVHWK